MLRKGKGRRHWWYQCKVGGKTFTRSTGQTDRKKAEAEVPRLQCEAQLLRKQPGGLLHLRQVIVEEVALIESDVSKAQAERVSYGLMNLFAFVGDVPIYRIDSQVLEKFQRHRLSTSSQSTVTKEIAFARRLLLRQGYDVMAPPSKRGKRTIIRAFSTEELPRFFEACPAHRKLVCAFSLATGARPAELVPSKRSTHVALLKSDLDFENSRVKLRGAKLRRSDDPTIRLLPLPEELLGPLQAICDLIPGDGQVFEAWHNQARDFDEVLIKASIPKADMLGHKLTMHSFRHTYATFVGQRVSGNPLLLKAILNHSQVRTVERYVHVTDAGVSLDGLLPSNLRLGKIL